MGAMLTYASYMSPRENLFAAAGWVTLLDTAVAVLAGFVVLPAVFAFGFDPAEGPGLTFITLPAVFAGIPAGALFGVLFFVLLALAALTSALSLLEVAVAYFVDEKGMARGTAAAAVGLVMFVLGIPASLSLGVWRGATLWGQSIFELMQYAALNLLLPLGGIFMSLFVGWVIWPRALAEVSTPAGHPPVWAPAWRVICRYIAPAVIAWILINGL
jgi:NSS family neurotransmitter:Na+ symporter